MKKQKVWDHAVEWFKSLFWAVVIALLVRAVLIGNFKIPSTSMVPTLKIGDRLIANKLLYRIREPRRGEVIIFHYPEDPKKDFVKRLIGLPGESILIRDGKILVNGEVVRDAALQRYYFADGIYGVGEEFKVPLQSYYVLGDNSFNSKDSRYWGVVPRKYLVGKALFLYWPPWRMGRVH